MDPILQEIYSTVLGGAPYVIAAYLALLIGFFGYVTFMFFRVSKLEKQLDVLESTLERRAGKA